MCLERKIFIVAYDYPPSNGGIARLCYEIKKGILKCGHSVEIVTSSADGKDLQNDLYVTRIPGKRPYLDIKILKYLRKNVSDNDIVITDTWYPAGMMACMVCKNVFILAHGLELISGKSTTRKIFLNILGKHVLNRVNGVIANSHFTGRLAMSVSPKARVTTLPLAVDVNYFRPTMQKMDDDILHLFTISRLEKFKGHDFVIDVVAKFNERFPGCITLSIGGTGPYSNNLRQQVQSLHLDNIVSFEGFIPDDSLCDHYSKNDLFILCTRQSEEDNNVEGFGLVFCEAQACGTPVVGTKTGGISDAVAEGNGGWLIQQNDEKALLDLLIKFHNDKSTLRQEGEKARKRMEQYDWSKYTELLLKHVGY